MSHAIGRPWEDRVAHDTGGDRSIGSGNRPYSILDVGAGLLVVECKKTLSESFRVTPEILDDISRQALGPSAGSLATGVLAIELGDQCRRLMVVDYDDCLSWLRSPPGLIPATPQDELRARARTPSLLRG